MVPPDRLLGFAAAAFVLLMIAVGIRLAFTGRED
jgi:hypothetical protein